MKLRPTDSQVTFTFPPSDQIPISVEEALKEPVRTTPYRESSDRGRQFDAFCAALEQRVPSIKLYRLNNYYKAYVLDKNPCPYTLGWVDFSDQRQEDTSRYAPYREEVHSFNVWSPRIYNSRYKYGVNRYLSSSKRIDTAVKKVATFFRSYSAGELVSFAISNYSNNRRIHTNSTRHTQRLLWDEVVECPALPATLVGLVNGEQQSVEDDQLLGCIAAYEKHVKDSGAIARLSGTSLCMVDATDSKRIVVADVHLNSSVSTTFRIASSCEYTTEELPVEITEKIAVLCFDSSKKHVGGVGARVTKDMFFVQYHKLP
jgi:hypothetical protein